MHMPKVALAACVAIGTLALAGCGLPGLGGGKPAVPVGQPITVPQSATPTASSSTVPVPSPTESATTAAPAPVAGMHAMKRPTKSYPDPKYPKGPAESRPSNERLAYEFEKMVWKAAGTADAKTTSGKCAIPSGTLNKPGVHKFTCTIVYNAVTTKVAVTYTTGSFISNYKYVIDNFPDAAEG